jgi:penicillin V acylase-like amidase (Ntn superfamily)
MLRSHTVPSLRTIILAIAAAAAALPADACTRAVYLGPDGQTVTGRSMDWQEDMHTNLWIFPRGMTRSGGLDAGSLEWKSLYGSVAASVYEGATADGMNEKGLVANILYLAESEYPPLDDPRPAVTVCAWTQYVLDRFATVAEAVTELRKETFRVVAITTPNGRPGTVHLAISDPSGDSAIFEYVGGEARHPSRPPISGDDQLPALRSAARPRPLLAGNRRHGDAARHEPGG